MNTITDYSHRQGQIAIFGDQIVSPRLDDISIQFQYNIATKDIRSGEVVFGLELAKVDSRVIDLTNYHIRLQPGEILTISASSASSVDVSASLGVRELF
jgi:hypothetical protein